MSVAAMRAVHGRLVFLEITGRDDLGANLIAPQSGEGGRDAYGLIKDVRPGDLVLHYWRPGRAIVASSVVTSEPVAGEIHWAARGTAARTMGTRPYRRPAWRVDLAEYATLPTPLTRAEVVARRDDVLAVKSLVESTYGTPAHFPFYRYQDSLRVQQAYLAVFPYELLDTFPTVAQVVRGERPRPRPEPVPGVDVVSLLANEEVVVQLSGDHARLDEEVRTRALRRHNGAQNELARRVAAIPEIEAVRLGGVDVAWRTGNRLHVAEVKGLDGVNDRFQLRMGLGQVLDYLDDAQEDGQDVRGVLFVSQPPRDMAWVRKCRRVGIELCWPGTWPSSLRTPTVAASGPD